MTARSDEGTAKKLDMTIPASAKVMGQYLLAGKGAGKSRMLGRIFAWQLFLAGIPQVIIDPVGLGTVDNLLDKAVRTLAYLPKAQRRQYWDRIVYIDVGGKDYVCPFPLYFRLGNERSLAEIANRYLSVIHKSSPELDQAPILGWSSLKKIGEHMGMVLAALNFQITEAEDLLLNPQQWLSRFAEAERRYPEVAPATAYFRNKYIPMRDTEKSMETHSFLDRVFEFGLDPYLKAMFGGANLPGINFDDVVRKRQTVLLDFRNVLDEDFRPFMLLWVFSYLYEWIKRRGRSDQPFAVLIDEFAELTRKVVKGENPLAKDLDAFINQYMRNNNIWLTVAHQSINQIDRELLNTLLSLGTYIFGRAGTLEEARVLADVLYATNPYHVKHERVITHAPITGRFGHVLHAPEPQREPVFMPLLEQKELYSQKIKNLGLFQFLLRPAEGEGQISTDVYDIHIRNLDRDKASGKYIYPDKTILPQLRAKLAAKSGIPLAVLLKEQESRLAQGMPTEAAGYTDQNPSSRGYPKRHRERVR
jgi:hypothetical protein